MFVPATNIPATLWASASFRVMVDFSGPSPVFSISPVNLRGMHLLGLDESASPFLVARFALDVPLVLDQRLTTLGVQGRAIVPVNPLTPTTVAKRAAGTELEAAALHEQVIFANDSIPPQGNPTVVVEYHATVWQTPAS